MIIVGVVVLLSQLPIDFEILFLQLVGWLCLIACHKLILVFIVLNQAAYLDVLDQAWQLSGVTVLVALIVQCLIVQKFVSLLMAFLLVIRILSIQYFVHDAMPSFAVLNVVYGCLLPSVFGVCLEVVVPIEFRAPLCEEILELVQ